MSLCRATLSSSKTYVRPKLREKGESHIVLKQCRHPCIENSVPNYIPNDVKIMKDGHRFYFVTGPNMGGKSTYIRSVALSVLLAQIGSFVPCNEAEISVVDAFFTRIGASDNPSKAMSTFMYEMLEMKSMITGSTSASLLIIDEMGRGTSTFDGFGLSWAISRRIAEKIKAPCLFATHFHDLTTLSDTIPSIGNLHVNALCSKNKATFLYRVRPGICYESFGIHVAKLAAFPDSTIKLAEKKLKELDESCISLDRISREFADLPHGNEFIQRVKEAFSASTFRSRNKGVKRELKELIDADGSNYNDKRVKLEPKELMDVDSSNYNESENILRIIYCQPKHLRSEILRHLNNYLKY
ncbi:DNA mismatch repair protein Msh2 [Nephila pilipes]|uniref:DNA mismatch repair protein Msh2 n=1 Tax=Nephila pilipes TaxID=299642 RepID=A0A8X6MBK6_NEPPI|nr:DNA mismatch repair protein Msh2 [Nephila pilipes]